MRQVRRCCRRPEKSAQGLRYLLVARLDVDIDASRSGAEPNRLIGGHARKRRILRPAAPYAEPGR